MIRFAHTASALIAAAIAAIATVPAAAADVEASRSVSVRHGDLNLASDSGVGALNRRIARAARVACGTYYPADLAAKSRALACRKEAVAEASPKVEVAVAAARKGEMYAGTLAIGAVNP